MASLKEQLISCLEVFGEPHLAEVITALKEAKKPIQDDEDLTKLVLRLVLDEMPELMNDPKSGPLKRFCNSLKYLAPENTPENTPRIRIGNHRNKGG